MGKMTRTLIHKSLLVASIATSCRSFMFDYNTANEDLGPENWDKVKTDGNDWEIFEKHDIHSLDVDENECGSDELQSPVNLVANEICGDDHEILTRQRLSTDCVFDDVTFTVEPHTLKATFPYDDSYCQRPSVDLPNGFGNDFYLAWMEVHVRSEHMLDGRRFDGEIQMVHIGTDGDDDEVAIVSMLLDATASKDHIMFQEMLDEWQKVANLSKKNCRRSLTEKNIDELTEVEPKDLRGNTRNKTKFHEMRRKNEVKPWTSQTKEEKTLQYKGTLSLPTQIKDGKKVPNKDFLKEDDIDYDALKEKFIKQDLMDDAEPIERDPWAFGKFGRPRAPRFKMWPYIMFPTIYYFRYKGSLTRPPCTEAAHWRVLDEPMLISRRQFRQLGQLLNSYRDPDTCKPNPITSVNGENYRPLQQMNKEEMEIVHCTDIDYTFWMYREKDQ